MDEELGALGCSGKLWWAYVGDEQEPQGNGVASGAPAPGARDEF